MAWIEVHDTLREHRKTYALASILKIEQFAAVGLVVSLWTWAINNAQDGDLSAFPETAIANACMWRKNAKTLIEALQECGFVTRDMQIHDWDVYAGKLIEQREIQREQSRVRQQKRRQKLDDMKQGASRVSHANVTRDITRDKTVTSRVNNDITVPNPTVPNHITTTTTSNARAREADDILSVTDEEAEDHRKLIERLEGKARNYGLPFAVGDIERTLRLVGEYSEDWVMQAIDRCSLRERRSWGTVQGILRSWKEKGGIDDGIPDTATRSGSGSRVAKESGGGLSEPRFPIEQYGGIVV